jgi:D-glycero-D-manno-heptose 1,7-bisphosphate phosphatase
MLVSLRKAVFLDRDGVINVDRSYVHSIQHFQFQEGIFELCRAAQELGYLLFVATNQGGIARGYYSELQFLELTEWMVRRFEERRIRIAHVYYCPYHPTHGIGEYLYDSQDRKPKPGMFLRARAEFNVDLTSSVLIGDQLSDMLAAQAAGIGVVILLRPGADQTGISEDRYYVLDSLPAIRAMFFR